jgi:hypothetical protein
MFIKRAISHTFNLAACTIGGSLLTLSSAALILSTLPDGGNASLSTFGLFAAGATLLGVGYGRAFGGRHEPKEPSNDDKKNDNTPKP